MRNERRSFIEEGSLICMSRRVERICLAELIDTLGRTSACFGVVVWWLFSVGEVSEMAACVAACAAKEFVAGVRDWRTESAVRWSWDGKAPGAVALLARGEGIGRMKQGRIVVKYSEDKLVVEGRWSSGISRAQIQLDELGNEVERGEEGQ